MFNDIYNNKVRDRLTGKVKDVPQDILEENPQIVNEEIPQEEKTSLWYNYCIMIMSKI